MQSNLAPAVTPRPVKHAAASPRAAAIAASPRGGRTYTTSPFKQQSLDATALRPAEPVAAASPPRSLRKKPLILTGDIRNLDSNFDLAMSRGPVAIHHVQSVFRQFDINVTNDEALALSHEFEENNDKGQSYAVFVSELAQLVRHAALHKTSTQRLQAKKMRLATHCDKLATQQGKLLDELLAALRDTLRVPWASVKDAFRAMDPARLGRLDRTQFTSVCASLCMPVSPALVDVFTVEDHRSVDYTAFLAYFGSAFTHGDTNSVGFSLVYARPPSTPSSSTPSLSTATVSDTLHSPGVSPALLSHSSSPGSSPSKQRAAVAGRPAASSSSLDPDPLVLEKLRILLSDKIAARHSDVKKAFMALDRDGNGLISASEFDRVLAQFNLTVAPTDRAALLASIDTNADGSIDYHEFFAKFGDAIKPGAVVVSTGGATESPAVKGANKNRLALSSPGNELKEALSRLPDAAWRAIFVELSAGDSGTGVVPSAELLRVLGKHLGAVPQQHYASLFRACGSHATQLMNYRTLVQSYRPRVMDAVAYFHQDAHVETGQAFRKSPTESLVMVWSIRVQRAHAAAAEWTALKEELWRADARRVGRIRASQFKDAVKKRLALSEDQAAFLCFFYEDKNLTADHVTVRYGSFLTDYEDSGLETADEDEGDTPASSSSRQRVEGKGRVRPPGFGIHHSSHSGPGVESLVAQQDEASLRQWFAANVRVLEAQLMESDPDRRGFVPMDQFLSLCRPPQGAKAVTALLARYIGQNHLYYRGFLLDFDTSAGLRTQALVIQDDGVDALDHTVDQSVDGVDHTTDLDVHTVREALRHHVTSSMSRQKAVYGLLQRMDPGRSGLLGYAEIRRALERLSLTVDEAVARELCAPYEDEEEATGLKTGRVKYLLLLHALGGRDPDKLDGLSDLASHCSYYSAISISPRAVGRAGGSSKTRPRALDPAARAVSNAIDKASSSSAAAASAVEQKLVRQLEGKRKGAWRQLSQAFQHVDSDRRGSVSASAFRKVLADAGVHVDAEDVARLQLKYDVDQDGRVHYAELLRQLTQALLLAPVAEETASAISPSKLPSLASPRSTLSESLRQGVRAKWKQIYASLRTLDKQGVGRVSAPHFRQLLEWYALAVADDEFLALLRRFDHDHDGGVDYNKFMKACLAQ